MDQCQPSILPAYREKTQAKRTHITPSTPSDVGHLLPPIGCTKARADSSGNPLPIPPAIEPSLPRPAPVDRNVLDLYDPALDPSPIGKEERGATQPVRISRVVPRPELLPAGKDSQRATKLDKLPANATFVTVINGYRTRCPSQDWGSNAGSDDENCVDIFVEGFSRGIDHATLLPKELFCRTLQNGSQGPPGFSSPLPGEAQYSLNAREGSLGLTVFLARKGDWFDAVDGGIQGSQRGHGADSSASKASQDHDHLAADASTTRIMFQRDDGKPGPSRNAFRVQFEPGPLGVEIEEHPGHRGIVRVRQVLQAGQAELDGRLSAGCYIVAVGDWGESRSSASPPPTPSTNSPDAAAFAATRGISNTDTCGSSEVSARGSNSREGGSSAKTHKPAIIRSLVEFEEAVSSRQPDRLFVIWALDRHAPEAIAALGSSESSRSRMVSHEWSTELLYARPQKESGEGVFSSGDERKPSFDPLKVSSRRRPNNLDNPTKVAAPEGAPGWDSGSAFGYGKDCLEYSLSCTEPGVVPDDRARSREERDSRIPEQEGNLSPSALGSQKASGEKLETHWTRSHGGNRQRNPRVGDDEVSGGWEFETGGGMFDDDDQAIASRRHPVDNQVAVGPTRSAAGGTENKPPPFPLGLRASVMDQFTVFIWFYNNHESATMNVRRMTRSK